MVMLEGLQLFKERITNKNNFFFATSGFAGQCVIHWATEACPDQQAAKIAILVNLVSRPLCFFNMAVFSVYGLFYESGYKETFKELGAIQVPPSPKRKHSRYENKPRAWDPSIFAV